MEQRTFQPYRHGVFRHVLAGNKQPRFGADAQPLALADGVEMRTVVLADLLAVAYGVAPRGGEDGKAFGRRFAVGSGDFGIRCSRYSAVFGRKRAVRPGV